VTKTDMIAAIVKLCPKDANPTHLKTKTYAEVREILQRWQAIMGTTEAHCNTDFLKGRNAR
jgi:hypothetical protein